ncbi:hypothetical protein AXE80_10340 [Wenyingzhuangia fucanilytica]|uniref:RagB/SusD family nutrient uptake outer membrane protein n=1 Tax=Wenyingzhuangia fucanilytica TaxID=1790137 RepID=A0A1B1Y7D2_9FLAO|nr:RagB/SusD family nutrient uptake outer membrane protein [Wenyingzhuangia fucanilytica]ANW96648.1 hypothetical protein AXE80_10340 [Wenyingzhuangia fucanilytica]
MKNTKKIIGILTLSATMFVSCGDLLEDAFDSKLTVEPKTQYSPEQVFSTVEGVETAVNGMYSQLQGYDYYGAKLRLLTWPHSGKYNSKQGANQDANTLNVTNTNINLDAVWLGMYQTINSANQIIENVADKASLSNRDTSLGQAFFIRAIVYFDLVRLFGEVPLRVVSPTKDELHLANSTEEEIYSQIIADLKLASQLLPDRGQYKDGRVLKYAANAYLAKVYVTIAGRNDATLHVSNFDPVLESEISSAVITDFWQEAADELDEVINNGGYTMTTTFGDLFAEGVQNTSESIFELQYGAFGDDRSNDIIRDVISTDHPSVPAGSTVFGRIRPNKEMFSDHVLQYGGLTGADYAGKDPAVDFIPGGNAGKAVTFDLTIADPRLTETYVYNSYTRTNNGNEFKVFPVQNNNRGNNAYPFLNKYKDASYNNVTTNLNIVLLRYAEVLLLRAEVENELNGPGSAYQYVNQVLLRARTTATGTTTLPADWDGTSVPDQDTFRERIMKEYEYELNGEAHEWFYMRRRGLGRFVQEIKHHNEAVVFYGSENNKDVIFGDGVDPTPSSLESEMHIPIPLSETSANRDVN